MHEIIYLHIYYYYLCIDHKMQMKIVIGLLSFKVISITSKIKIKIRGQKRMLSMLVITIIFQFE